MVESVLVNDGRVMSKGQAEAAGFTTDEDVANWITESRRKENAK